ncbi:thiol-disulfide oxidoreductase DCC family protein [Variovorax sp. W6]|uniref:thiol-disulfide oxidoreductase DCC family protein n=1 Tax=Variovorax sp. W6 TaxID=3093895 RepID=UPI003D806E27
MSPAATPTYPLTIYFDASCAICSAEMGALKARDAGGRLQLVDCSPASFTGGPAPREALMATIHVSDAEGRVHIGVPAIRICRTAVGLSSGSFLLDLPVVAPLADRAYALLARNRYRIPRWLAARLAGRVAPSCDDNCRI